MPCYDRLSRRILDRFDFVAFSHVSISPDFDWLSLELLYSLSSRPESSLSLAALFILVTALGIVCIPSALSRSAECTVHPYRDPWVCSRAFLPFPLSIGLAAAAVHAWSVVCASCIVLASYLLGFCLQVFAIDVETACGLVPRRAASPWHSAVQGRDHRKSLTPYDLLPRP